jgi:hypothetical protein
LMLLVLFSLLACERSRVPPVSDHKEDPIAAQAIEDYLQDFGVPGTETSWYQNIRSISVRGDTVYVKTDLSSPDRKSSDICAAVSAFVFSKQSNSYQLTNVQVHDGSGIILIHHRGIGGKCD